MGFANTLEKMLEEEQPTHIAVAWDTHVPTFRHKIDEESNKANRPPQPEELKVGIPLIKEKCWKAMESKILRRMVLKQMT
ncbi:MAG: hypothetical protein U5J95_02870 [Balneolaceae bacterium]|nr:hypothetical protein [Balneolaceae bacterium]